ncbi:hypothetical protein WJX72_004124 [[Myrmecia] bisecta]|uniref:Calcium-dependent protein kinase n=1 Tax=[Myrmecia] bisecta TaxID=41462 RepID=A0AAW1QQA8_9CHLO
MCSFGGTFVKLPTGGQGLQYPRQYPRVSGASELCGLNQTCSSHRLYALWDQDRNAHLRPPAANRRRVGVFICVQLPHHTLACSFKQGHRSALQPHRNCWRSRAAVRPVCVQAREDYPATASDSSILQLPSKQELTPRQVKDVFGYPRTLRKRYDLGKVLGAGSFGIVREATEKRTGRKFACKTVPKIPKRGIGTPRYLLKIQTEVDAMEQLGGSLDAVSLQDVYEDDENVHIVMELCLGGGILERIKSHKFSEKRIADIIRSVLRFIAQCHAKGIIFRDVKPDNFLFLTTEPDSPVRATDFGLSIRHWPGDGRLKSRSGTPVYMAPEVILQDYGNEADVWSVGMLMYQLITGRFPFWESVRNLSLQQVWQAILMRKVDLDSPSVQAEISDGARDLLKGLLKRKPSERMTAAEALQHPWAQKGGCAPDLPLAGTVVQRLQRFGTYGALKQLVLKMITGDVLVGQNQMTDMLATMRELFNKLDADKSGGLDIEELVAGLQQQGYTLSRDEVVRLRERVDLDEDGMLVFDEFATGLLDWKLLQQDRLWTQWVDVAFSKLDVDGDGHISLEEIVSRLPPELDDDDEEERLLAARRMLREADSNGDGRISREEFLELLEDTSVPDMLSQYDPRLSLPAA